MKIRKNLRMGALAAASAVGLVACGGGSETQDVGTDTKTLSRTLSARAVDGYLAGATVYVDQNENGRLDSFEPRAFTDKDGFFSYNHLTKTDYCAAGTPAILAKHCLKASLASGAEALIRVTGGYDSVTQLPFEGTLSLRSSKLDSADLRLVTPMTSMLANSPAIPDKLKVLIDAGILSSNSSLDEDFLSALNATSALRAQLATVLVRSFAESAIAGSGHAFEEMRNDTWYSGYVAMASKLADIAGVGESHSFTDVFSSEASFQDVVRQMVYAQTNPGGTMPSGFTVPNEAAAAALAPPMTELVKLSDELVQRMQASAVTPEQLKAALRIQAVIAERALANPADAELPKLFAWARNQLAQNDGLGSDLGNLGGQDIDLSVLIEPSFKFDPLSNLISASAVIPAEAAQAFLSLKNTAFRVNLNDRDRQGAALVFIGDGGHLNVCVRYRDTDGDFNTGNASNPNGALLVKGGWVLMNDYTLILSIDIAGGVRPLMIKSVGGGIDADRQYRFDFGGDLATWSGTAPTGFAAGAVPANDAACTTTLVEQFGPVS